MSVEERTDFVPRWGGCFPEKRLKEIYGEEKYNKNLEAARQAQLQKVGNFLGSFITNIPGFVGLKGVFPSTAIARDAEVANPQPYIVNDSGHVISTPALGVAETYNQEYDNFLNNYFDENLAGRGFDCLKTDVEEKQDEYLREIKKYNLNNKINDMNI